MRYSGFKNMAKVYGSASSLKSNKQNNHLSRLTGFWSMAFISKLKLIYDIQVGANLTNETTIAILWNYQKLSCEPSGVQIIMKRECLQNQDINYSCFLYLCSSCFCFIHKKTLNIKMSRAFDRQPCWKIKSSQEIS